LTCDDAEPSGTSRLWLKPAGQVSNSLGRYGPGRCSIPWRSNRRRVRRPRACSRPRFS